MADIIVALDKPSAGEALAVVDRLGEEADFYKVGLELFTRSGPAVVEELKGRGKRVFLDLKLHDIPNTVARSVDAAGALGVEMLTVHAAGGHTMLSAAAGAAREGLRLLAVTVLTSLTPDEMGIVWSREIRSVRDEVGRLAELAHGSGIPGVVASAREASWIRRQLGEELLVVTPGIRPLGVDRGDQKRVATPADAVRAGSNALVIGRPVTEAEDPPAAFAAIVAEVRSAVEQESGE